MPQPSPRFGETCQPSNRPPLRTFAAIISSQLASVTFSISTAVGSSVSYTPR